MNARDGLFWEKSLCLSWAVQNASLSICWFCSKLSFKLSSFFNKSCEAKVTCFGFEWQEASKANRNTTNILFIILVCLIVAVQILFFEVLRELLTDLSLSVHLF